jgi:DNA repair exonuclease SbcCD ATPase subunit
MLRIFLIVAILASLGVIAVSQLQVKPHIEGIIKEREDQRERGNKLDTQLKTTNKKLNDTLNTLTSTKRTLEETQAQLTAANGKIEEQGSRLDKLQKSLDTAQTDLNTSKQKLAQWEALPISPDKVQMLIKSEQELKTAVESLESEKKILQQAYTKTKSELDTYKNPEEAKVELPAGLKGKVLVVDPKWNFVVLDIGEKQGILRNGVLMVSRNSKLIAKVKVTTIESDRSIANIMPGWKLGDVMEGDLVFY